MNRTIDTIIKLGVIAILVVAATTKQQYSYYRFERWAIFATSIYFTYRTFSQKQTGLSIFFGVLAILFNPFKPVWFQKATLHLINYIIAGITLVIIYFDWAKFKKKEGYRIFFGRRTFR